MVAAVETRYATDPVPESHYRLGMYVALAGILMLFTALTSAYIVRSASSNDWQSLAMPRILLLSTALLVISSGTLEAARRKLRSAVATLYTGWLSVTLVLGFGFLISQFFAWRELTARGIYLASGPHSSFFYLLTATHGLHLLAGLLALAYLLIRASSRLADRTQLARRQAVTDAITVYWHFMDVLWIYLFLLLFVWK